MTCEPMDYLTPKQEKFALSVAQGMDQATAYRNAFNVRPKTKPETVWSSASRMLANRKITARVNILRDQIAQQTVLKAAAVLNEIRRIAFADPAGIANPNGTLKRIDELDPDLRACVASYQVRADGTVTYRFWDKLSAIDKACRILGLYERDNSQKTDALSELLASLSGNVQGVVPEAGCRSLTRTCAGRRV